MILSVTSWWFYNILLFNALYLPYMIIFGCNLSVLRIENLFLRFPTLLINNANFSYSYLFATYITASLICLKILFPTFKFNCMYDILDDIFCFLTLYHFICVSDCNNFHLSWIVYNPCIFDLFLQLDLLVSHC